MQLHPRRTESKQLVCCIFWKRGQFVHMAGEEHGNHQSLEMELTTWQGECPLPTSFAFDLYIL